KARPADSASASASVAALATGGAGAAAGAGAGAAAAGAGAGAATAGAVPPLRTRTFSPSCSSSNSFSSCSRTRSRICLMSSRFIGSDSDQLPGRRGEQYRATLSDKDVVFHPRAPDRLDVGAWFNRQHHPWFESRGSFGTGPAHARALVHLEAESVPGRVQERFPQSTGSQYVTGCPVDLPRLAPRSDRVYRCAVGGRHGVEQ